MKHAQAILQSIKTIQPTPVQKPWNWMHNNQFIRNVEIDNYIKSYIDRNNIRIIPDPDAFCSRDGTYVKMPDISKFKSAEFYYSIFLHELTHTTHHKVCSYFNYHKEEMRAELSASILCHRFGIITPELRQQHINYIARHMQHGEFDFDRIMFEVEQKALEGIKILDGIN